MIGGVDDLWLLQIVLGLLYLMECVWWVSPRSVILERTRRRDRFRWPMADVTVRGRVPVLLNPLTPWRQRYVLEPLPFTVTTAAVVLMPMQDPRRRPEPTPTNDRLLRWDDIAGIWHEDRSLFLGRGTVITCRSPAIAEQAATFPFRLSARMQVSTPLIRSNWPDTFAPMRSGCGHP